MGKRLSGLQKWYFNIVEQCPFFLRGEPMICLKNLKFLMSLISFEKYLDMIINNVLNVKKGFLDYKNAVGQRPMISLKNLLFLPSQILFEKYLDMMFNNVLNGKKRLPWL